MTDTYNYREHVMSLTGITEERRAHLLTLGPKHIVEGVSKPFELARYGDRVFYMNFDERNPLFCEWTSDPHFHGLERDVDFRCEDAGWPMSPPGFRLIYARKEDADAMVERWKDRITIIENCKEQPPYTYADPDYRGYGW